MKRLAAALLALPLLTACASSHPGGPSQARERTAVLLSINDVYRIEGVEGGKAGGLSRVRALREELEREYPDLLMLHAGDLLFPSFASRMYKGEQMVAVLNDLDGDPQADDPRMFVTFGNHEFEKLKLADAGVLAARVKESQFHWLGGNVVFKKGADGEPLVGGGELEPHRARRERRHPHRPLRPHHPDGRRPVRGRLRGAGCHRARAHRRSPPPGRRGGDRS